MAIAHDINNDDGMAYSLYIADSMIKPKFRKYPERFSIDEKRIRPKETLTETFTMHLNDEMFEAVKEGAKTVEVRLFDEKRKLVDVGDYIEFRKKDNGDERLLRRVAGIKEGKTFRELFERNVIFPNKEWDRPFGFIPKQLGAAEVSDIDSLVEGMYKHYSREQEEKFGAIAFELENAERKHLCKTYLSISYEFSNESVDAEKSITSMNKKELSAHFDKWHTMGDDYQAKIEKFILDEFEVTPVPKYCSFEIGCNEVYNADINEMLRITLKGLLGKEEKLREFSEKFSAAVILKTVSYISADSKEPQQNLLLESDIIGFLRKSGIVLDLDCYVF